MSTKNPIRLRIHAHGEDAYLAMSGAFEARSVISINGRNFKMKSTEREYFDGETRKTYGEMVEVIDAPWDGNGLPPVGTVCEFAGGTPCPEDPFDKDLKEGMPVTIIAHIKGGDFTLAAFTFDPKNPDRGMVQVEMGNFGCFRPIRTPEQIAAEERDKAITEIADILRGHRDIAELLYDAGYRKQVVE